LPLHAVGGLHRRHLTACRIDLSCAPTLRTTVVTRSDPSGPDRRVGAQLASSSRRRLAVCPPSVAVAAAPDPLTVAGCASGTRVGDSCGGSAQSSNRLQPEATARKFWLADLAGERSSPYKLQGLARSTERVWTADCGRRPMHISLQHKTGCTNGFVLSDYGVAKVNFVSDILAGAQGRNSQCFRVALWFRASCCCCCCMDWGP
jgi:hypothetical protein